MSDETCLCFLAMAGDDGTFSGRAVRGVREALLGRAPFAGALSFRAASSF